jgi:hypothetical protein
MKITKNLTGSRKHGCKSITITLSKQRIAEARRLAWILGYPENDLGRVIAD